MGNVQYEAINLKGLKFKNGEGLVCEIQSHFGLYVEGKGFVSFIDNGKKELVKLPYANNKKVINEIINAGGLINFSNVEFLNPI
ncbi:hypothetical protein ACIQZG_22570 [Lysinibacillus sp. NPDC096418]|uniref:hypothetical protein n=1 Tax=Lysinibacillus sp. NPDC096418 TaxID=3364138 RepID=UPI0037F4B7D5